LLVVSSITLHAQLPHQLQPGGAAQLQLQQPPVDVSQPEHITATAEFDPPVVAAGGKTLYRVMVEATQNSITWPSRIIAPAELKFGSDARGQLSRFENNKFRPLTAFAYEVTASEAGRFVVSHFVVQTDRQRVEIPAARLDVLAAGAAVPDATRRLKLVVSETNLYYGQPFRVRVLLPSGPRNEVEALREIQINGAGFMADRLATRQLVEDINLGGQPKPAFVYETVLTPMAAGPLVLSAQAFTAGRDFGGPISISGQVTIPGGPIKHTFLVSDEKSLTVRPLPADRELPGFTGATGKFIADPPQLSTNRVRVGEPLHLKFSFQSGTNLARYAPPEMPRSREWQIIPDQPPVAGCTLIPLTDEATNTPAIPFSAFDPATEKFYDLTIPAFPVTVTGEGLPTQLSKWEADENSGTPLRLGSLAQVPGKSAASLKPLQLQGWFVFVQFLPVAVFIGLWRWDERRRFLEAHPEIVRRRRAKRELRREQAALRQAIAAGDAGNFARHAAAALRIAVAPHFPADAQAMVGGDVLSQLDETGRAGCEGETVRKIFMAADAQFAVSPQVQADLLALAPAVESLLKKLEAKL
jgi:hypothetical protein